MADTRQRVVVTCKVSDPLMPLLREHKEFDVVVHDSVEPMTPDELVEFVRGAHAIVSIADDRMTADVFEAAGPDLKIMANYAVGYDNVDLLAHGLQTDILSCDDIVWQGDMNGQDNGGPAGRAPDRLERRHDFRFPRRRHQWHLRGPAHASG